MTNPLQIALMIEHIKWLLMYRPEIFLHSENLELIEEIIIKNLGSDEEILYSFLEKIKDYNVALVQKHLATFEEGWKKAVVFFSGNPEFIKPTLLKRCKMFWYNFKTINGQIMYTKKGL